MHIMQQVACEYKGESINLSKAFHVIQNVKVAVIRMSRVSNEMFASLKLNHKHKSL